ncbi:MAG: Protein tyrosine and serine/threonine kinase [Gammaproteobacteria bacterium]|jgi:hypothetical protein|nr:Protein tyrosine and serine/threonine kinase [Gammaproteobacteria bacterium]
MPLTDVDLPSESPVSELSSQSQITLVNVVATSSDDEKYFVQGMGGSSAQSLESPGSFLETRKRKYQPESKIGEGATHFARRLAVATSVTSVEEGQSQSILSTEDQSQPMVVVKPKQGWLPPSRGYKVEKQLTAFKIFTKAYPDLKGAFYHFRDEKDGRFTYRVVLPHLGRTLQRFMQYPRASNLEKVLVLCEVAVELQRIHNEVGYVHGDVKANNIALMPLAGKRIRPIYFDFELSTRVMRFESSRSTPFMAACIPPQSGIEYMAPERIKPNEASESAKPFSLPNQDVYSFGFMLREMFREGLCPALADPKVSEWARKAVGKAPSRRPSMEEGIKVLRELVARLRQEQQPTVSDAPRPGGAS